MRATWAPRGITPVLRHRFSWKRLSMSAALAYAHDRSQARIIFQTRPGSYNDDSLIEFLQALHAELAGAKVTLIWDGLPSHRSRSMQAHIRSQRHWLVVKRLLGYAPDLNPVEGLWGKHQGHRASQPLRRQPRRTTRAAHAGIDRVRSDHDLAFAFLRHCGLSL
ncbi:MAG: transposase [Acidimicrobiales bacterium]